MALSEARNGKAGDVRHIEPIVGRIQFWQDSNVDYEYVTRKSEWYAVGNPNPIEFRSRVRVNLKEGLHSYIDQLGDA